MTIMLVFSALALTPSTGAAADDKHCDSKPFTLKKPMQSASAAPAPEPVKPKPVAKPKAKVVIGCKQPDSKKSG